MSYVGPDLRRHFAPVTFESKMTAERWLTKERDRIERCAASDEGLPSWKAPKAIASETKAEAVTVGDFAKDNDRRTQPESANVDRLQASLKNYIEPELGRYAVRDLTSALVRSWVSGLGVAHPTRNAPTRFSTWSGIRLVRDGLIESSQRHERNVPSVWRMSRRNHWPSLTRLSLASLCSWSRSAALIPIGWNRCLSWAAS